MNITHPFSRAPRHGTWTLALAALALAPTIGFAQQYTATTPRVIATPGDVTSTLGGTTFVNHGLVGVGRISASTFDSFGETFGSVSGLQITNWKRSGGSYSGTFNILPDRGYNNNNAGGFFSNYAARIQEVNFSFTPYTGDANIGGTDIASQIAAQSQITFTSPISGVKFTYTDPNTGAGTVTTGLDPGTTGSATIFGKTVPYVIGYTGQPTPAPRTRPSTTSTSSPSTRKGSSSRRMARAISPTNMEQMSITSMPASNSSASSSLPPRSSRTPPEP